MTREAAASSLGAAALGAATGSIAFGRIGAYSGGVIGFTSGYMSGLRKMYDWSSRRGRLAFLLDHTWALTTTASGVLAASLNALMSSSDFRPELSERKNRLTFGRGVKVRRGFAVTFGYVVNGAAARSGQLTDSRVRLVERHEDAHVWQARLAGPVYPVAYAAWSLVGGVVGVMQWARRRDSSLLRYLDVYAYYRNPFEWHAYSRDGNWPPAGIGPGRVWRRPFPLSEKVRSTSQTEATPH